jgi:hypothetical protein
LKLKVEIVESKINDYIIQRKDDEEKIMNKTEKRLQNLTVTYFHASNASVSLGWLAILIITIFTFIFILNDWYVLLKSIICIRSAKILQTKITQIHVASIKSTSKI